MKIAWQIKRRIKANAAMHQSEPNEVFVEVWQSYENADV